MSPHIIFILSRQADHEQKERYDKYLEEMQKRVEKRPLLFEKETQVGFQ